MSNTNITLNPTKNNFRVTFPLPSKAESKVEVLEVDTGAEEGVTSMRTEATKLQKNLIEELKKLKIVKQNSNLLESKLFDCEAEMQKIAQDRDKHKELYANLVKNKIENKIVIDSQKRLMDKYIFITEQIQSRPSTGKTRPVTASGLRLNMHKNQNHGL